MLPLTICSAPTAGKSVLAALLEGHENVFSTPLWHDQVSVALVQYSDWDAGVDHTLADGIYGTDLRIKYLRHILATETEWWGLEIVGRQGFYIFHLSGIEMLRIPIILDFYSMDRNVADVVWRMDTCAAPQVFSAIFTSLRSSLTSVKAGNERYAVSLAPNEFSDYRLLMNTYPGGKVIYIDRDPFDAIGSTIYRRSQLLGTKFKDELNKEFIGNNDLMHEIVHRKESVQKLQIVYPENLLCIDFSELILDTERTMHKVCKFLNILFTPQIVKATFQGRIIDERATGKIQDDMRSILSENEQSALSEYIERFRNITRYNVDADEFSLPASLFLSYHPHDSLHNIIIDLGKVDGNIFYGPYMRVPQGIWRVVWHFSSDKNQQLPRTLTFVLDCIDDTEKQYFQERVSFEKMFKDPSFIITVQNNNHKFEFRAYGECETMAGKINFHGVSLCKIQEYIKIEKKQFNLSSLLKIFSHALGRSKPPPLVSCFYSAYSNIYKAVCRSKKISQ
jgi:hypothetical protein